MKKDEELLNELLSMQDEQKTLRAQLKAEKARSEVMGAAISALQAALRVFGVKADFATEVEEQPDEAIDFTFNIRYTDAESTQVQKLARGRLQHSDDSDILDNI